MLKPALARGELRCIGATTLDEYRKHIEKDKALERRFQPVFVGEPSVEDTVAILRGLKERYEVHHGIRIRDAALVAAARLSHRYITGRQLPDKAIDLVDEAASRLKMEIDSLPEPIDQLERRLTSLAIEEQALGKEKDAASRQAAGARWRARSPSCASASTQMKSAGSARRPIIAELRKLKEEIGGGQAPRRSWRSARGDLNRAAELRFGRIPELEKALRRQERGAEGRRRRTGRSCARRSPRRTSPPWSRSGPASRSTRCWRASRRG